MMKYNGIKLTILTVLQFIILSGCSNNELAINKHFSDINWQLKPEPSQERSISDIVISYDVPSALLENKLVTEFFTFKTFHEGDESKQEKLLLFLAKNNNNLLNVERRTDNGVAGSGVIYDVEVREENIGNSITKVSFIVTRERKYQEGLVFPFAVPDFEIKKYLTNTKISYEFEVDSKYDKESVQDNFRRLLGKNYTNNIYIFNTKLVHYRNKISLYSYRGGTKIKIVSLIEFLPSDIDVIYINKVICDLKNKIKEVIDS